MMDIFTRLIKGLCWIVARRRNKSIAQELGEAIAFMLILVSVALYFFYFRNLIFLISAIIVSSLLAAVAAVVLDRPRGKVKSQRKNMKDVKDSHPKVIKRKLSDAELLTADVDTLSGTDFERLIELYYRSKGLPVERIGGAGDHGVDLIVHERDGARVAVQCKRQRQDVGNAVVLKLDSGRRAHKCHVGRIVTTAYFTRAAEDAAERLRIELHGRAVMLDKLEQWRKKTGSR